MTFTPLYLPDEFGKRNLRAVLTKVCRGSGAKVVQKNIQVICRIITSGTLILSRRIGSHVEFDFRALRNWARAGMVEWNGIFWLFRFSGISGQPRELHPKFRNEIPENVCSIRSQTRNFRNFWSNGKRPLFNRGTYSSNTLALLWFHQPGFHDSRGSQHTVLD